MTRNALLCTAFALLLPAGALALEDIVGEWSGDPDSCREMRLIFDFEGNHSSVIAEDGRWRTLAAAPYRREGDVLIVDSADGEERLEIIVAERDRLVLRNRSSLMGDMSTELVRCPAY
jgi:hypothetical protein